MAANQAFHPTPESLAALRGRLDGGVGEDSYITFL